MEFSGDKLFSCLKIKSKNLVMRLWICVPSWATWSMKSIIKYVHVHRWEQGGCSELTCSFCHVRGVLKGTRPKHWGLNQELRSSELCYSFTWCLAVHESLPLVKLCVFSVPGCQRGSQSTVIAVLYIGNLQYQSWRPSFTAIFCKMLSPWNLTSHGRWSSFDLI